MPAGLIAKLHSFSGSNSTRCLSFIAAWASALVCAGVSFCAETGVILPSIFMDGGKSSEIKRSDAFLFNMTLRGLCRLPMACSLFMGQFFLVAKSGHTKACPGCLQYPVV